MIHFLSSLFGVTSMLSVAVLLSGCTQTQPPAESSTSTAAEGDYVFSFTGKEQFDDGQEYNFQIKADKDSEAGDHRFVLSIDELSMFELGGMYTYLDNKGYKLYFEDVDSQFVYTSYDTETEEFSFKYKLNLGEALGTRTVVFSYQDAAFKDIYDGEGLGLLPPTFEGSGWGGYLGQFEIAPAKLTCYEDGTAYFTAVAVTAVDPKTGTWDYDETTNTYHFYFPPQTIANNSQSEVQADGTTGYKTVYGEADVRFDKFSETTETDFYTTYDDATGTYHLDLQIVWYVYSMINLDYTP